jgi:hypothetical protein
LENPRESRHALEKTVEYRLRAIPEVSAMKRWETKLREWKPIHRFTFLFLGLMFIAMGSLSLLSGRSHYRNVFGAAVFVPFVIFVGFLCLLAALRLWKRKLKEQGR